MASIRRAASALGFWLLLASPAAAAPDFYADCIAPESTTLLRIEACSFALRAAGLDDARRVAILVNRAKGYTAKYMVDQASRDLAEARRLAPADASIAEAEADLNHFAAGRNDRAIAGYKTALEQPNSDPATLLKLGVTYAMAENYPAALQTLDQVLARDPDNAEALMWRSTVHAHDKHYDKALADLERAVAKKPENVQLHQWRAEELLYAGSFDRAIGDMDLVLAARPKSPFHRMRGIARYAIGEYQGAAEDFAQDLDIDPVYANLAVWRYFAEKRAGGGSTEELRQIATALGERWPRPLLDLVLGERTPEQALAAAAAPDPVLQKVHESQAHCIIGEWLAIDGRDAEAQPHFAASRDLDVLVATDEVKAGRALIPPDTLIEFAWARARTRVQP